MLKKLKNSFLVLVLALSMIGCVDQSGKSDNNNLTIAATSVAVTEILEALDVPADQVIGIPTTESYTVPKKYNKSDRTRNCNVARYGSIVNFKTIASIKP